MDKTVAKSQKNEEKCAEGAFFIERKCENDDKNKKNQKSCNN
jgi:hypothetical protein